MPVRRHTNGLATRRRTKTVCRAARERFAGGSERRKKKRGMIPFRATDGDKSHGKHAVQSAVLKRSDLRGEQW